MDKNLKVPVFANNVLFVTNLSRNDFSVEKLSGHFNRFGDVVKITLIEPKSALVEYKTKEEATHAWKSSISVLDNRFITVEFFKIKEIGKKKKPSFPTNITKKN